jgi:hypothetical protein
MYLRLLYIFSLGAILSFLMVIVFLGNSKNFKLKHKLSNIIDDLFSVYGRGAWTANILGLVVVVSSVLIAMKFTDGGTMYYIITIGAWYLFLGFMYYMVKLR